VSASLDVGGFELDALLGGCVRHLTAVRDESSALFPYSTRLVDGRYVNDYGHPDAIRYTINSLLGLSAIARAGNHGVDSNDIMAMIEEFLDRQEPRVVTCADAGLLMLLLVEHGLPNSGLAGVWLERVGGRASDPRSLNMQDLAWALWGACAATRAGLAGAEEMASAIFAAVRRDFLSTSSGLPRHTTNRYRRDIVSFGSLVYFLRAMHEFALTFDDRSAAELFEAGVRRALAIQGPRGEWPWLIRASTGAVVDPYPVFSVHQDSMAMLFLLPAVARSIPGAVEAVPKSLAWCFGANELSEQFYVQEPFFAYRSIERVGRAPRLRRYVRALTEPVCGDATFDARRVRVNRECRSYHLGWILYAWAGRLGATVHEVTSKQSDVAGRH
jgi:hypothetical protein